MVKGEDGEERVEKKKKEKISIFEMRKSLNNDKKEESTFFSDLGIIIKNPVFLMGIVSVQCYTALTPHFTSG